jgi:succinyl-diaminopimelate desuccinylase
MMLEYIHTLFSIESPTNHEKDIQDYIKKTLQSPNSHILEAKGSLIAQYSHNKTSPHIVLVGHTDVVPAYFVPYKKDDFWHAAGASDMKAAVGVFMYIVNHHPELFDTINLSLISYVKEEGTPIHENGLHDLIQAFPEFFKTIDLAIVGEPTNNTVQLGCVGSIHADVKILGKSSHSARPWDGENALYKALPFIKKVQAIPPKKHTVFGVDFYDVISITESHSEPGRTTIPGYWAGNVNFRYSPTRTLSEAEKELAAIFEACGLTHDQWQITDAVYSGDVVQTPLFEAVVNALQVPIEAKQAWTDVAQLASCGIPAFNFGPGLTEQAHKPDEYIRISDIHAYYNKLINVLKGVIK